MIATLILLIVIQLFVVFMVFMGDKGMYKDFRTFKSKRDVWKACVPFYWVWWLFTKGTKSIVDYYKSLP